MKEYYASFKRSRWFPLVTGILLIILGFVCIANPQIKMESIALYFGVIILIYGVLHLLAGAADKNNKNLKIIHFVIGAVVVVLAILVFANMSLIGKYLPTLVGFFMIVFAIMELFRSLVFFKNGLKSWWAGAIPALIVLVLGFVFLLQPGFVGATFGIFTGITMLLSGVSGLVSFIQFKK